MPINPDLDLPNSDHIICMKQNAIPSELLPEGLIIENKTLFLFVISKGLFFNDFTFYAVQ